MDSKTSGKPRGLILLKNKRLREIYDAIPKDSTAMLSAASLFALIDNIPDRPAEDALQCLKAFLTPPKEVKKEVIIETKKAEKLEDLF